MDETDVMDVGWIDINPLLFFNSLAMKVILDFQIQHIRETRRPIQHGVHNLNCAFWLKP